MNMKLTVLSWNIWGGKKRNEIIEYLKTIPFDIAALQEVTVREKNGNLENDAEEIAKSLGYYYSFAKSFTTDRHTPVYDMGNAIVSKYPISRTVITELSDLSTYERNATTEPRNVIHAEINLESTPINILCTHLGYSENLQATPLQLQQTEKLLSVLPSERTVLMGDFNSEPSSQIIKRVEQHLHHTDSDLSKASWINMKKENQPRHRIDYIFTSGDLTHHSFKIGESNASDHFPLHAEIEI